MDDEGGTKREPAGARMTPWTLVYDRFDPVEERRRETLCTLGNGYFATRGAAPESSADGVHYPGTYVAGCYNRLTSRVAGRAVTNEELVNVPNWLPLAFATPGCAWFHTGTDTLLDFRQTLDLRHGVLYRLLRYRDGHGRVTLVRQRRIVSMADPHLAALETTFLAENWSGIMRVTAALDGSVVNGGVERYRGLRGDHLVDHATGRREAVTWLRARTSESEITVALASRVRTGAGPGEIVQAPARIATEHEISLEQGRPAVVTKTIALATSRDHAIADARSAAVRRAALAPGFGHLLARHRLAWARLWRRARLQVDDPAGARIVHLHTFHLLQTLSPHTADLDVGVPARGLHGEAYRGHVFWDELFVLPWLNVRFPETARALLRYRWRRLPEARVHARALGLPGALFPWQSGSDGQEDTQLLHLNPRSGHWTADNSHLQRHVGLAIAYNVWQHFTATGDLEFLRTFGAELLVEIARCFAGLAQRDPATGRYEIRGIMGPDEYHDAYPGAAAPGLDNNAYTNIMTVWLLLRARRTLALLPVRDRADLTARLELYPAELERWEQITRRMRVDFHDGVISQFTGYAGLLELDWERYRGVRRLDRALEAEGDSPNRYRASKQADVLMLFYLLPARELLGILRRLGCPHEPELVPRTVHYYLRRTSHGSTLSAVVHAWVLSRSDRPGSWRFFTEALGSDVNDVQGGTTSEGVHLGAMAGTLDLVQRCYLGLEIHRDGLGLNPLLPEPLARLSLPLRVHGAWLTIDVDHDRVLVCRGDDGPELLNVVVRDQSAEVGRETTCYFPARQRRRAHERGRGP
ncbi:glycoside hydrolase family 65 protein [Sphaerisporangium melleum]|uniref:glycoside hydrolase family 65 protein n=1 Tax=Sphaerisporangium melleum TaxID=321316 RepID=UPI003557372D